jgi:hypothetical protein
MYNGNPWDPETVAAVDRWSFFRGMQSLLFKIFFPMLEAVRLASNYDKISRQGTATILLSKHIICIAVDKLLIGMELPICLIRE